MNKLVLIAIFFSNFLFAQTRLTHEVYFETDRYNILPTEQNRLLQFISKIDTLDIAKISIYGFCDDRGSDAYNLRLSQDRANSIKEMMSNNEVEESLITNVDGKGEVLLKIVKDADIVKIRGLNRKVEIIVTPVYPPRPKEIAEMKSVQSILNENVRAGDKFLLENILFKTGYDVVLPESKKVLDEIVKILKERNDIYFTIQGHVCCTQNSRDAVDRKTKKRNLSVARAKYIYNYLAKKGINKRRMKYLGMRRKFPLGGDPKYDRRVEILVTYVAQRD